MKIVYVINSLEGGGAASPVPALTRVMRDHGAEVRILALARRDGRALPPMEAAGLEVRCFDGSEKAHIDALRWLIRESREFGATHIWTSLTRATLLGQLAGMRLRLPVVSWQHNAFLKPWNLRLLRMMQSRSAIWIGDSQLVTDLTATRLKIPPDRLFLWQIFRADPHVPQARPWRPGETLRLGSLGRLHPAKGYDILIEALRLLRESGFTPPCRFHAEIAGEGAARTELETLAASAGVADWISFPGFASDPAQWLSGLHVYVQPSRREGLCIAVHEAMQAGLPVIASRVGEMPYSVRDPECGRLVEPTDAPALTKALRDLLSQPESLARKGQAARAVVLDKFSAARFEAAGRAILDRMTGLA